MLECSCFQIQPLAATTSADLPSNSTRSIFTTTAKLPGISTGSFQSRIYSIAAPTPGHFNCRYSRLRFLLGARARRVNSAEFSSRQEVGPWNNNNITSSQFSFFFHLWFCSYCGNSSGVYSYVVLLRAAHYLLLFPAGVKCFHQHAIILTRGNTMRCLPGLYWSLC